MESSSSTLLVLDFDCWPEVLKYFRCDLALDSAEELREKRKSLYALALLERSLTELALNLLWESMNTLKPIIGVVNASASSKNTLLQSQYGYRWELQHLLSKKVYAVVKGYLGRIRFFSFDQTLNKARSEVDLWQVLVGCFGQPLLPNLHGLAIVFSGDAGCPYEIFGVVPNALKHLKTDLCPPDTSSHYDKASHYGLRQAMVFYKVFVSRGGTTEAINYKGPSCEHLLSVMASFTDLKCLRVVHSKKLFDIYDMYGPCTISLPQVMRQFPSLTSLQINLEVFPTGSRPSFCLRDSIALEHLHLTGDSNQLQGFISGNKCTTLQSLSLGVEVYPTHTIGPWKLLCEKATVNFPRLRSFTLESGDKREQACPPIAINDLRSLFSLSLSTFALKRIPHMLHTHDIVELSRRWPNICHLTLVSCGHRSDPAILVPLSGLRCLKSLTVRLNFRLETLHSGRQSHTPMLRSQSWLEELIIVDPESLLPPTMEGKFELAGTLLDLFPNILTISSNPEFGSHQEHDMQKIMTVYKGILVHTSSQRGS